MQRFTSLLAAGLIASGLAAQAGPGMTDADPGSTGQQALVKSTYFSSVDNASTNMWDITPAIWTTAGRNMTQVYTNKTGLAGLGAGEYCMCFTSSLFATTWTTAAGGTSGSGDVMMGKLTWNSGSPVFTPTTLAAKMNSTGNDFGLMIDGKDGTRGALDWPSGPRWSRRASNAVQFPTPVALTGAGGTYVDPQPGHIDGVLGCFWVSSGTEISWAPVKETPASGTGPVTAASLDTANKIVAIKSTNQPHSPTALFHSSGNATSMWFSRVSGSDSEQYYSGQIPDTTGGVLVYDSTAWSNNGGCAGSRFLCAYSGHYNTMLEGRGSHMGTTSCITVSSSAVLQGRVSSPVGSPPLFTTLLLVSASLLSSNVTLPGILGELGANPGTGIIVGGPTGSTLDETAYFSFPASDSSLKGATLHMQMLTRPIAGASPAFTNTSSPAFKN